MLKAGKEQEAMGELADKIKNLEDSLAASEGNRRVLEAQLADLVEEKNKLFTDLEKEKSNLQVWFYHPCSNYNTMLKVSKLV